MAITDHYTNARLVTFVEPPSLIKAAVLDASAFGGKGATPKTIGTTTTTTRTKSLQLKKFRTFEEMLESHSNQYSNGDDEDNNDATPVAAGVLVDFYSPWCGPCKVMKHELMSIRQRLESLVRPRRSSQSSTVGGVSGSRGLGTPLDNNANVDSISEDDESKGGRNAGDPIEVMSVACMDDDRVNGIGRDDDEEVKEKNMRAGTAVADATKPITASTTTNDAVGIPVYHIDTNKFPQVGARNNVRGLPTLVLFVDGKEVWRNEGILSGEEVINSLTKILSQLQKDDGDE
jgi:thiol-disulfide isomerase/thioredoxin